MENEERVTRKRSEKRKRIRSVFVRLTEDEYRHASEQASTAGMKPPRLARELNERLLHQARKEVARRGVSSGNLIRKQLESVGQGHEYELVQLWRAP